MCGENAAGRIFLAKIAFFACINHICDYLGVTPKEFFDTENKNPTKTAAIAEKLKTLSDDQLHLIEAMIDSMQK